MLYVIIDIGILYVALYAFFSIQVVHYCISITYISMFKRKSGALLSALQPNSLLSSTHIDRQGSSAGTSSHTPVLFIHINSTGRKIFLKKTANPRPQTLNTTCPLTILSRLMSDLLVSERVSAVFIKGADCSHGSSGGVRGRLPAARLQTVFKRRSWRGRYTPVFGGWA